MKKLLILLMLVSWSAFAKTAKEALAETKAAKIKIAQQEVLDKIEERKEVLIEIQKWIDTQIKEGLCTYNATLTYDPETVSTIKDHFQKLGYDVKATTIASILNATQIEISWCSAK